MKSPMFLHLSRVALALISLAVLIEADDLSEPRESDPASVESVEAKWGITVEPVRVSAGGYMIDFRYKVLDPAKSIALGSREDKPYLIDEASGRRFLVPKTPKVGPLRQTAVQPKAGKVYWMVFSNPGKFIKAGSRVTVVIGEFKLEHLEVQ